MEKPVETTTTILGLFISLIGISIPIKKGISEIIRRRRMKRVQITEMLKNQNKILSMGDSLQTELVEIKKQVTLNGGSSMKDSLARIEDSMVFRDEIHRRIISYIEEGKNPIGTFETDEKGKWVFASDNLLTLCDMTISEVLGDGWKNSIHQEDLNDVVHYWKESIVSNIDFKREYKIHSGITIHCYAKAVVGYKNKFLGYHGTWYKS